MSGASRWLLPYVLNAAWQVPLLLAAGYAVARVLRRLGPAAEHRAWVAVLLLQVTLPAVAVRTVWQLPAVLRRGGAFDPSRGMVSVTFGAVRSRNAMTLPDWMATAVLTFYLAAVLYFAVRLVMQALAAGRLQRAATTIEPAGQQREVWELCKTAFRVRGVALATSQDVFGPVTMGVRSVAIVVPPLLLRDVAEADLRTVLAHELAHVARRDFLKNLLYEVVALPLKFHPAYWATRARLVESREMVCDARAAAAVAGTEPYARSLVRLASTLVRSAPAHNAHAIGLYDAHSLERRIMRLTEEAVVSTKLQRAARVMACLALGCATCAPAMLLGTGMYVPATEPQAAVAPAAQAKGPAKISAGIMAGQTMQKVTPVYPPDAKAKGIQGAVVLSAIVSKDGHVRDVRLVSGPQELAESAITAVSQWVYRPYLLNGQPTEVETTVTVNYHTSPDNDNAATPTK